MVRPMVCYHVVLVSNALRVPTLLFAGVSCLLKLVGLAGGPDFEPGPQSGFGGFLVLQKKDHHFDCHMAVFRY